MEKNSTPIAKVLAYTFVLLIEHMGDVAFHRFELLVDVMQEVAQVRSLQLTSLYQDLHPFDKLSQ